MSKTSMTDAMNHEHVISEFRKLTGASPGDALYLLSSHSWDLSSAVEQYFRAQEEYVDLVETQEEADAFRRYDPYNGALIIDNISGTLIPLINNSSQRYFDSVLENQPSICKSVTMHHLCERCSTLRVIDKQSESFHGQLVVSEPSYESVKYLVTSAQGNAGKACHFCALILRSLKGHRSIGTTEEETCLPSGPITISLLKECDLCLIARCGTVVGFLIQLSLGIG